MVTARKRSAPEDAAAGENGLWYKDAIIYQLHVRAFHDSDNDGVGDFAGLTEKLDYIRDLGVSAVWILPFYASPLRDDGYDIASYTEVHPHYGNLRDFSTFLREAKRRGLRVITELVLNHTSDQHPWFQRARRAPAGSPERDFYVWSDTPDRYASARIIFKDFEPSNWSWDNVANAYYWHRFYSHQPDLNFDNPRVHSALREAVDFWLGMGVDGLRLDAVPYLYEREGTSCENLPETHAFLRDLRKHVDSKYAGRMLLAEANQWPEDAAEYFGQGDECHMNFHFPLMPRLFMSLKMEDRFPIIDILEQTPPIPENCQWGVFLRNHDELTLEMLTDEDRDYMYRVYAQDAQARVNLGIRRRLAPLMGNNRRRIELLNGLLFSLPGAPVLYYGDEIGMGDNIYLGDRNAVRTPMQWSGDRNAGFSRANPQRLYLPVIVDPEYHYETVNVEAQQNSPYSLFWWMKRLVALRKRHKAFSRGSVEFLYPENRKVLAFVRRFEDEVIMVIANLSRFVQYAELDLSAFKGVVPVELFGGTKFPSIGELPYFITLGPHAFYWFSLRSADAGDGAASPAPQDSVVNALGPWQDLLGDSNRRDLEAALPSYLMKARWFGGKARSIRSAQIIESVPIGNGGLDAAILLATVEYVQGESETYQIPIAFAGGEEGNRVLEQWPDSVVARVKRWPGEWAGVLYDATANGAFLSAMLDGIARGRRYKGVLGQIGGARSAAFRTLRGDPAEALEPSAIRSESSNTLVAFDSRLVLKIIRRPDAGEDPDLEMGRFITAHGGTLHTPRVAGHLEYTRRRTPAMTLAVLHEYIQHEGDAWGYALDSVASYLEGVMLQSSDGIEAAPPGRGRFAEMALGERPGQAADLIGPFLQAAELLGRRTGEIHASLASDREDADFRPEPFTPFYQRAVYQGMRASLGSMLALLRRRTADLSGEDRVMAEAVLEREDDLIGCLKGITQGDSTGMRIRVHGDFHLGQVLFTGKDFVIIDFEGEPARPLSERRLKRSPLRDVAGMIRSFHYAASEALRRQTSIGLVRADQVRTIDGWVRLWYAWVSAAYLRGYLEAAGPSGILPASPAELQRLLDAFLAEKAIYEVGYELNNRPDWVGIPLRGLLEILEAAD